MHETDDKINQRVLKEVGESIPFSRTEEQRQTMTHQVDWIKEQLQKSFPQKRRLLEFIRKQFRDQQRSFKRQYPTLTTESEIRGITEAIRQEVLELHTFQSLQAETMINALHAGQTIPNEKGISPSAEAILEEFMDVVSSAVTEGATYPMFDDTTGQLVQARLEDLIIYTNTANDRFKQRI